jgi:hypothetical protein
VPSLEPAIALETIERSLRQLYSQVFETKHGPGWLTVLWSEQKVASWIEKRAIEHARRGPRGVATVSTSLLDFAEFYDLIAVAEKDQFWIDLQPALGVKRDTLAFLRRFDQLRNTVAHSRQLLPFEADLLSGVAGEIRNKVTIWMSTVPSGNEYWARIESVTDSFGHVVDGLATVQSSNPHVATGKTLHVGDVVEFTCRAVDPKGREITWTMDWLPNDYSLSPGVQLTGDALTLRWTVQPHHASSQSSAIIRMRSASASHRWTEGVDGMALFHYAIVPSDRT